MSSVDIRDSTKLGVQESLKEELERLTKVLKLGYELKVRWLPNSDSNISGKVRGDYIYIYDKDRVIALETLKHEFIDYAVSKAVEPYKEVTNKLIALVNEKAYQEKEKLVKALCLLID